MNLRTMIFLAQLMCIIHLAASCLEQEFECNSLKCIPRHLKCDGQDDCGDNSDEINCTNRGKCDVGEFQCIEGVCISSTLVCNGKMDCPRGLDEINCDFTSTAPSTTSTVAQGIFRMADGQNVIPFSIFEDSPGITIYLRFTAHKCVGHLLEITSQSSDQFFLLSLTSDGNIRFLFKTSMGPGQILIAPPRGDSFCSGKRYLLTLRRYLEEIQYRVNRGKRFRTTQEVLKAPFPRMYRINVGFGFEGCVSGIDVLYYRTRTDKHAVGASKECVISKTEAVSTSYPTTPTTERDILTTSTPSRVRKESESRTLPYSTRSPSLATTQPFTVPAVTQDLTHTVTQSHQEKTSSVSTASTSNNVTSSNDVTRSTVLTDSTTIQRTIRVTQSSPSTSGVTEVVKGTISKNISTSTRSTQSNERLTSLPTSKTSTMKIPRCRPLPPMCAGLGYRQTLASTKYVKNQVRHFLPFIRANCSTSLKGFLCAYYFPSCPLSKSSSVQPCRELCLETKYECAPLMKAFEFEWSVDCETLPSRREGKCTMGPYVKTMSTTTLPTTLSPKLYTGTGATQSSNEIITLRPAVTFNVKPTRRRRCGGILRHPTGDISTPNYPHPYPSDAICQWAIILPEVYRVINFLIEDASLESDPNCGYDYLFFKDGLSNQVGPKICGFLDRPRLVTIKGHIAVVVFRSDSALNKKGIFIKYEARWR